MGSVKLEASSDFRMTLEEALKMAINQAMEIVSSMPKQKTYDFEYSRRLLSNV